MTKTITITWKAFGNHTAASRYISSASFDMETANKTNEQILNDIYEATNLQDELAEFGRPNEVILLWETIKPLLSPTRTHTSLSIGDEIVIDLTTYEVSPVGFTQLAFV